MKPHISTQFLRFLREELRIPSDSISLALRHQPQLSHHFPMVLWKYGLVTLEQLNQIFEWMETA